jgi:hypothetical protein
MVEGGGLLGFLIVDIKSISSANPTLDDLHWIRKAKSQTAFPAEYIQKRMTATKNYNLWPQSPLHTQWPGVCSFCHICHHSNKL